MKKLYIILFIVFIITDVVIFLLFTKNHQISETVKNKLITKSLVEQTRYLTRSSDSLKSLSSKKSFCL